ncbi:MAG: methyltransferase type 11 [uncultured bacterium]|nr:MAG: methyltransferase type 11 [uncultured bacterium]OGH14354.1 MAG: hypothetical protein A2687_01870 [Candidatus Levybacteria bacterium RIFCSPHIGHO2_01_FULL_38_26]
MDKTQLPTNFIKHTTKNPLQKLLINNFYSTLVSLAKPINPNTVLDAGCGEGFTLNKLMSNNIGKSIEGVEYTKEAITLGKKLFPKAKIKSGSIYELPYKNNSFDLVICTEVLEHMEYPQKALLEALRVSKKHIILSVPNEPFFRIANLLTGKYVNEFGNSPGHINHWTFFSFQDFIKKRGIKITKIKLPFPWIIVLAEK